MTTTPATTPDTKAATKPASKPTTKGPASYFPSIEKTYGQPMAVWLERVRGLEGLTHMQRVAWLKAEHGMGHGHANAIVAFVKAADGG